MAYRTDGWSWFRTVSAAIVAVALTLIGGLWSPFAAAGSTAASSMGSAGLPIAPMHVWVVRSTDPRCRAQCGDWIALDGPIGPGSFDKLARALRSLGNRRPAILINSVGGSVNDAIAIGRLIRSKHLDVAVSRTELVSCPADRAACETTIPDGVLLGAPDRGISVCASACPLILAGGVRRFVAPWTNVGVHEFKAFSTHTKVINVFRVLSREVDGVKVVVRRTLVSQRPVSKTTIRVPPDYSAAKSYLAEMGIDSDIMRLYQLAPPEGIYWLSKLNMEVTKLETSDRDGSYLVFHGHDPLPAASTNVSPTPIPDVIAKSLPVQGVLSGQFENAFLKERDGHGEARLGEVNWTVEDTRKDLVQGPVLVATVALQDDVGTLTMRLDHLAVVSHPDVLRLSVALHPGIKYPFAKVQAIGSPAIRKEWQSIPIHLSGVTMASSVDSLEMLLPWDANGELISTGEWIDVPITLNGGKGFEIDFARGISGDKVFSRWQALDHAHTSGTTNPQSMGHGG